MAWLVVAMGVLLMLVGVLSVISGAPIIQLERGWAEVISGSVGVSGGVIAFALGIVLFRLQGLQQAVTGRSAAVPDAGAQAVQPSVIDDAADPVDTSEQIFEVAPMPLADEPRELVEPAPAHPNLWKRVSAPPIAPLRPTLEPVPSTVIVAAAGLADAADEAAMADAYRAPSSRTFELPEPEPVRPRIGDTEARARRLTFPPSDRSEPNDAVRKPPTVSRDWMSRPLLRQRPPEPPPSTEPPPLFAGLPGDVDDDRAPAIEAVGSTDGIEEDADAPRLDIEAGEPSRSPAPQLAVVGKYQAGSSTYTMYANGSIDVETEGGEIHHFTSMDELKAFIARQESATS